jgi:hypothetical protein
MRCSITEKTAIKVGIKMKMKIIAFMAKQNALLVETALKQSQRERNCKFFSFLSFISFTVFTVPWTIVQQKKGEKKKRKKVKEAFSPSGTRLFRRICFVFLYDIWLENSSPRGYFSWNDLVKWSVS